MHKPDSGKQLLICRATAVGFRPCGPFPCKKVLKDVDYRLYAIDYIRTTHYSVLPSTASLLCMIMLLSKIICPVLLLILQTIYVINKDLTNPSPQTFPPYASYMQGPRLFCPRLPPSSPSILPTYISPFRPLQHGRFGRAVT